MTDGTEDQASATTTAPPPQSNGTGTTPAARPEYIPEKFWDGAAGQVRLEDFAKAHKTLESERGKFKETLTAEINSERFKARPEKPEGYKIAAPETFKDVVILDKPPGDDFKPEAGKRYAVLKADSPLMKGATALAHKYGVPQAELSEVVGHLAREMGQYIPTPEEANAAKGEVYSKLGEHGAARADHAWKGLTAAIGDKAKALDAVLGSAEAIEAVEALLEKAQQPKFSPGNATAEPGKTEADLKAITREPDYWTNPEKQKVVEEGYKKLFPAGATPADRELNPSRLR